MIRLGICGPIENIEVVAKMGFDYLEAGLTRLSEIDEAEFRALRDRVQAAPIRVEAFNGMLPAKLRVTGSDVNAQALHEYLDKTFARAKQLGGQIVVFGSSGARNVPEGFPIDMAWRQICNFLRLAERHAIDHDITIAIEPLRRAECAQLLYNLTQDAPRSAEPAQYDDVLPEYWYYEAVSTMGGYLPQEEGQTCFFPSASVMPDTFLTALLSALGQTEQSASPALLQAAQALMPDGAQAEDVPAPAPITRAQAAVLVNRALGRKPDTEAINGVHRSLLLDVPEDRADYADLVEAVLPHDYYLDDADEQEHYRADALDALSFTPGIHLSGTSGFFVDADGRVVRGTGFLDEQNRRYYRCDETGRILADYAPHYLEGHAVFVRADGILRRNGVFGEYLYDENGFYTTGNTELDAKLDDFIAACTTEDMTQEECLHACYEAVRALRYLGRNPAYGPEVKTIPYDKQLEFADKILSTGKGDCYNFAAVFCLLARKLGYLASPIVGECGYSWNWYPIAHGWVEIELDGETFLFDPQIENYNLRAGISNETHSAWQVTYESAPARYLKH